MPTSEEKAAFSKRLELAMRRTRDPIEGPTELALKFSLRHKGPAVSAQTAHKWLSGRAIPTDAKLATLADWLNVDKHWLHYGPPPVKAESGKQRQAKAGKDSPSQEAIQLALRIHMLPPHSRYLIEELVNQLQSGL